MGLVMDCCYAVGGLFALPFLLRKRWKTGKYRSGLTERLGLGEEPVPQPHPGSRTLLLHCVSMGEVNSVQLLVRRLLAADENLRIVVTTGTDTGTERAQKLWGVPASTAATGSSQPPMPAKRVFPVRMPFDFSFAVERLFDRTRPDAIALVELETWPNFLEVAADRQIPVAIINGRLSERSFPRYRLIRPVMAEMLRQVGWVGAQTATIAARFKALGAQQVEVLPTLKYDNAAISEVVAGQQDLGAAMGLTPAMKLIVAGSTGPGEQAPLLEMHQRLANRFPELRLAIVPRHPEVVPQVVADISAAGLSPVRRTDRLTGRGAPLTSEQVFVLDTMGELRKLYGLALGVFVGRSLIKKGGGGSDMIEVAALGKASCFGPYTANFAEVVELLTAQGGAVEVPDGDGLTQVVEGWLSDPLAACAMGRRAQELIRQQQAARSTDHYVERILSMMSRRWRTQTP